MKFMGATIGSDRPGSLEQTVRRAPPAVSMTLSKIFTLNKLHMLEKLCSITPSAPVPSVDYFHAGHPVIAPPRVRATMILRLNRSFLTDNAQFFECGSPVDMGAIRFGLLQPPDAERFLTNLACDHGKFASLISELERLPEPARASIARHQRTNEAEKVLKRHFDPAIVKFMLGREEPAAWSFEFSLKGGYRIGEEHVEELLFPRTYENVPLFSEVQRRIGKRARTYSLRVGLENAYATGEERPQRQPVAPMGGSGPVAGRYDVVGVFEDFRLNVFPTHALPIVAAVGPAGLTRWNYRIQSSCRIQLLEPVGKTQSSPEKLFPVFTYRVCAPQRFSDGCQVIALSETEIVVSAGRAGMLVKLLFASARNLHDPGYLVRAWKTAWDCLGLLDQVRSRGGFMAAYRWIERAYGVMASWVSRARETGEPDGRHGILARR